MNEPEFEGMPAMPEVGVEEVAPKKEAKTPIDFKHGEIKLDRFRIEAGKKDEIWFTGVNGKAEKIKVPHMRDILFAAQEYDLNGLSLEHFLMGYIVQESKSEKADAGLKSLAAALGPIIESDEALRTAIQTKMRPDK